MIKPGIVKIDAKVHRLVKVASAINQKTIAEIINEAIVEWLEKNSVQMEKEVAGAK